MKKLTILLIVVSFVAGIFTGRMKPKVVTEVVVEKQLVHAEPLVITGETMKPITIEKPYPETIIDSLIKYKEDTSSVISAYYSVFHFEDTFVVDTNLTIAIKQDIQRNRPILTTISPAYTLTKTTIKEHAVSTWHLDAFVMPTTGGCYFGGIYETKKGFKLGVAYDVIDSRKGVVLGYRIRW